MARAEVFEVDLPAVQEFKKRRLTRRFGALPAHVRFVPTDFNVANTKYTTHQNLGVEPFIGKNGMPSATDPETGKPTSMNLMSDARFPTPVLQAQEGRRAAVE
jgi:hypothetical protein